MAAGYGFVMAGEEGGLCLRFSEGVGVDGRAKM